MLAVCTVAARTQVRSASRRFVLQQRNPGSPSIEGRFKVVWPLQSEVAMIALGLILLIAGFLLGIPILWTLGVILLVVGAVLALLGGIGRPVGGRAHYY